MCGLRLTSAKTANERSFSSIGFKITVNRLIMKLDGKNIVGAVRMSVFYDHSIFKRIMNIFNLPTLYVRHIVIM